MTHSTTDAFDVHLPDAPAIPGLRFRRVRDAADWEAQAAVYRAANMADGEDFMPTGDNLRIDAETWPGFEIGRDLLLAEIDGRVVARAEGKAAIRDGRPVHHQAGSVHPDVRRRGIGRAMLRWNEGRARAMAAADPTWGGPRAELDSSIGDREVGAVALLRSEGYRVVRYGFTMINRRLDLVEPVPVPDGIEIRPVRPEQHRAIWAADDEAFHDHWEHRAQTEGDFVAMFAQPELDTSLWRVGWAGDAVAGSVQTWIWASENEALGVRRGWLERISVRRPWRRIGLAKALIASALIGLRERGMDQAMLGVDAENPSGALGLYESVGFEVDQRWSVFRKPLFPED